ncbi:MAG: NUDIX hydrolase [Phycisphaerales bacterium]|nr:NUDIX hydrolase [Phycisphaerales bacterium]
MASADPTASRDIVLTGPIFDVERMMVPTRAGERALRHIVRHPGAVCVAGVLDDGRLVSIRNFRIAVGEWLEEFCAGKLERGEDPSDAARREFLEETGYRAGRIERLGTFLTSPGFADEVMHAFVARDLKHVGQRLQDDERIEVVLSSPAEFASRIRSGAVRDGKTISTWALLGLVSHAG